MDTSDEQESLEELYRELMSVQYVDIPLNSSACSAFKNVEFINSTDGTIRTPIMKLQKQAFGSGFYINREQSIAFSHLHLNCLKSLIKDKYVISLEQSHPYLMSIRNYSDDTNPCLSLLHDKSLIMYHYVIYNDSIWVPYLKSCIDEGCNSILRRIKECSILVKVFQHEMFKWNLNTSSTTSGEYLRFSLIPTIPWSCPRKVASAKHSLQISDVHPGSLGKKQVPGSVL